MPLGAHRQMRDDVAPDPLTPASAPQAPGRLGCEDPRKDRNLARGECRSGPTILRSYALSASQSVIRMSDFCSGAWRAGPSVHPTFRASSPFRILARAAGAPTMGSWPVSSSILLPPSRRAWRC